MNIKPKIEQIRKQIKNAKNEKMKSIENIVKSNLPDILETIIQLNSKNTKDNERRLNDYIKLFKETQITKEFIYTYYHSGDYDEDSWVDEDMDIKFIKGFLEGMKFKR